jgi:thymidylate kinase
MPESIYICGPDGSGKSTFLNEIQKYLEEKNERTKYVWLRSPKILSKPLMGFCRFVGLTRYFVINGTRYGGHEFYRSKVVSCIFPILQLTDFKIMNFFLKKKFNKSDFILIDRHAIDTLADLMVDTHRFDLHQMWIGRSFINLLPENTKIIVLDVEEDTLRNRKNDVRYDPQLTNKIKVYRILGKDLRLIKIDNNREKKIVIKDVFFKLGLNAGN